MAWSDEARQAAAEARKKSAAAKIASKKAEMTKTAEDHMKAADAHKEAETAHNSAAALHSDQAERSHYSKASDHGDASRHHEFQAAEAERKGRGTYDPNRPEAGNVRKAQEAAKTPMKMSAEKADRIRGILTKHYKSTDSRPGDPLKKPGKRLDK